MQIFRHLSTRDLVTRFRSLEFLRDLDGAVLQQIADGAEWIDLYAREILFRKGDTVDGLYIVLSGRLRVVLDRRDGCEEIVAEIGRNEMVGEVGILTCETRSATVEAVRDSCLIKVKREVWYQIAEKDPGILLYVAKVLAKRLAATSEPRPQSPLLNLAVIAIAPKVPLGEFSTRLAAALSKNGATLHLSGRGMETVFVGGCQNSCRAIPSENLDQWLCEQETQYGFIVFELENYLSAWTQYCMRRADRFLLVGGSRGDPALSPIEKNLFQPEESISSAPKWLILIHPDGSRQPVNTEHWLAVRQVNQHFHIRWDSEKDFERLARFIKRKTVGLVLGAGGARGFAHIGVIRALEEAQISVDMIAGSSMGSFISAGYALGLTWRELIEVSKDIFSSWTYDFTLPYVSLMAGRRGTRKLMKHFGLVKIEDLWTPFFCVSSNLTRASLVIHREGFVWHGVRSSCSLPGVMPPVPTRDGDLLIDGGLLNNLPVDLMKKLGGSVIGVDVSVRNEMRYPELEYVEGLSGWRALGLGLGLLRPKCSIPNIAYLMMRTSQIGSMRLQQELEFHRSADLYLCPPVQNFKLLDFEHIEQIAEAGYHYAIREIAGWQAGSVSNE